MESGFDTFNAQYLDELVRDMRQLNSQSRSFPNVQKLLNDEIDRIWTSIYNSKAISKAEAEVNHPTNTVVHTNKMNTVGAVSKSSAPTTPHYIDEKGDTVSARTSFTVSEDEALSHSPHQNVFKNVTLEEKIPIPYHPRCNFIGRILGPRGITIKQIEAETECNIFIRGRGSVKDPVREAHLINHEGWEHLSEPLHVLIKATDVTEDMAKAKLRVGVAVISNLLTSTDDEHKRRQLIQLAIINGTYRCD